MSYYNIIYNVAPVNIQHPFFWFIKNINFESMTWCKHYQWQRSYKEWWEILVFDTWTVLTPSVQISMCPKSQLKRSQHRKKVEKIVHPLEMGFHVSSGLPLWLKNATMNISLKDMPGYLSWLVKRRHHLSIKCSNWIRFVLPCVELIFDMILNELPTVFISI